LTTISETRNQLIEKELSTFDIQRKVSGYHMNWLHNLVSV